MVFPLFLETPSCFHVVSSTFQVVGRKNGIPHGKPQGWWHLSSKREALGGTSLNVRWPQPPQPPQPPGLGGFAGWRSEHLKHQHSQVTRVKGEGFQEWKLDARATRTSERSHWNRCLECLKLSWVSPFSSSAFSEVFFLVLWSESCCVL